MGFWGFGVLGFCMMWCTRRARDLMGLSLEPVHCWWMLWPLTPFFWRGMTMVADVACSSWSREAVLGTMREPFQKVTFFTAKGVVLRVPVVRG